MPIDDQDLAQLIRSSTIETVDDVIAVLRGLDSELANDDGLKWFNLLYLKVTEAVGTPAADGSVGESPMVGAARCEFRQALFCRAMRLAA